MTLRSLPVHLRAMGGTALLALAGAAASQALAADFAVAVSPPRFEVEAKPGERLRQVLEIQNMSNEVGQMRVRTADWRLRPDGTVDFFDELQPGSCRPWVAIERRDIAVLAGRPYRFRFEITPPADVQPTECRFAIMLEGRDQTTRAGQLAVPFNARVGVIVYATVGGVAPELTVVGSGIAPLDGRRTPVVQVRNAGTATGRLGGFLSGTDAANAALEFSPSTLPILPGETRTVPLVATRAGNPDTAVDVQFPVTVRGKLEWGKDRSQPFEQRFGP